MLLEMIAAIAILAIVVMAIGTYRVMVTARFNGAFGHLRAENLCISQIEDLNQIARANFADPKLDDGLHDSSDSRVVMPAGFTLSYSITDKYDWTEDGAAAPPTGIDTTIDYKEATATCTYATSKQVSITNDIILNQ